MEKDDDVENEEILENLTIVLNQREDLDTQREDLDTLETNSSPVDHGGISLKWRKMMMCDLRNLFTQRF